MIKKLLFLLLLPTLLFAQIPAYYSSVDFTQTGENLKVQLANLITTTHTTMLPYTSSAFDTWDAIMIADEDPHNTANVLLVYGFNDFDTATNNDRSRSKTARATSNCIGLWNREHTFPQSLANPPMSTSIPGVSTDIHHLRAADCQFNSTRGNKIFEDGQGDAKSMSTNTWYPGDEWKGDVARMMMYLYVRYGNETPASTVGFGSRSYSPLNDMPNIFLEWNIEDPVSIEEIIRNEAVFNIQGNRNPFIDNPYLATLIWSGPQAPDFWNTLTCSTATTWNGTSWNNGVPNKSISAIINGDLTLSADLEMCGLTIGPNANVTVPSGINLTVVRSINVDPLATLTVSNNANLVQINYAQNNGVIKIIKDSAPIVRLDYTAWAAPVSGQNLKEFSPNTLNNRFYEYIPSGTTTATAYNSVDPLTNDFIPTKGYIIRAPNNWSTATASPYVAEFIGTPNNGYLEANIQLGYNLIGNPFPSTIQADEFIANNRTIETLYFWTHTAPASGGVYPVNNFASYTTLGVVAAAAGGLTPDGTIKPGQGFYVYSSLNEQVLFHNGQRIYTSNNQFFRNQEEAIAEKNRIWLNLYNQENQFNQILIGYTRGATNNFDWSLDGKTMDQAMTHLFSTTENNEDLVIQARQLENFENDTVKLGVKMNTAGTYTIAIDRKDGAFTNWENIWLKDNFNGTIHNLNQSAYSFISEEGTNTNRFEIFYKLQQETIVTENNIIVFNNNNLITINSSNLKINQVQFFDILGRELLNVQNIENQMFETNQIQKNNQAILIKITLENGEIMLKKAIH